MLVQAVIDSRKDYNPQKENENRRNCRRRIPYFNRSDNFPTQITNSEEKKKQKKLYFMRLRCLMWDLSFISKLMALRYSLVIGLNNGLHETR